MAWSLGCGETPRMSDMLSILFIVLSLWWLVDGLRHPPERTT